MRSFGLIVVAASLAACSNDPPQRTPPPAPAKAAAPAAAAAPAKDPGTAAASPTRPTPTPLSAEAQARVKALAGAFKSGSTCNVQALAELRQLRETHGVPPLLGQALMLAFKACDEPVATAELHAELLPDNPSQEQRLKQGATWLRATRYDEAIEVLLPLANEAGADSKAAWLAGFALFHAGRTDEALPWLQGARTKVGKGNVTDAPLLIGLSQLHAGNIDAAITELEAGRAAAPEHPGLLGALARAYAAAGRTEDSTKTSEAARAANAKTAEKERQQLRLAAKSSALKQAMAAGRTDEADGLIDELLPHAPTKLKAQLLGLRVKIYTQAGRSADAAEAKLQLQALAAGGSP
ncbi:MAG: hypothetical protein AAF799_05905 [Myxococcota bacterium]